MKSHYNIWIAESYSCQNDIIQLLKNSNLSPYLTIFCSHSKQRPELKLLADYFFSEEKESIETIYISTSSISQEYYWYETSYQNYMNAQGTGFFSQPVQVYTNIQNGLGVFAGYSTRIDSIVVQ